MNAKQAINQITGIILFAVLILLFWWGHHHPHSKPYSPPAVADRWNVYDHEVCRNTCPAVQCTSDACLSAFEAFNEYELNDTTCQAFWTWFENAQAEDALPDSFYYCAHGKQNQWEENAQKNKEYLQIWECNWGPQCSENDN